MWSPTELTDKSFEAIAEPPTETVSQRFMFLRELPLG